MAFAIAVEGPGTLVTTFPARPKVESRCPACANAGVDIRYGTTRASRSAHRRIVTNLFWIELRSATLVRRFVTTDLCMKFSILSVLFPQNSLANRTAPRPHEHSAAGWGGSNVLVSSLLLDEQTTWRDSPHM